MEMKTLLSICLGAALLSTGQAQLLNQESFVGAALGAGAGAIIGNQHHGQSGEGAAIGAGVGYVLGQAVHYNRQQQYQDPAASYPYNNYPYYGAPAYAPSYGNGYYASQPAPIYQSPRRLNYALTGAALGAGAGAIIGNQHHGQSGEGAAIGAAAGLLLGGVAEYNARRRERAQAEQWAAAQQVEAFRQATAQAQAQSQAAAPAPAQAPVPPATPASSSNLKGANQLFGR